MTSFPSAKVPFSFKSGASPKHVENCANAVVAGVANMEGKVFGVAFREYTCEAIGMKLKAADIVETVGTQAVVR